MAVLYFIVSIFKVKKSKVIERPMIGMKEGRKIFSATKQSTKINLIRSFLSTF